MAARTSLLVLLLGAGVAAAPAVPVFRAVPDKEHEEPGAPEPASEESERRAPPAPRESEPSRPALEAEGPAFLRPDLESASGDSGGARPVESAGPLRRSPQYVRTFVRRRPSTPRLSVDVSAGLLALPPPAA